MVLDDYSQSVADGILREFPELYRGVAPGHSPGRLLIRVRSPHTDTYLYVSTEDDEITIGFGDWWHKHVELDDRAEAIAEAISLIRSILNDELVIAVWRRGGEWIGSMIVEASDNLDVGEDEEVTLVRWCKTTVITARG